MSRSSSTFSYLICFAFSVALLGLLANLMHLSNLTKQRDEDRSFYFIHPHSHLRLNSRSLVSSMDNVLSEEQVLRLLLKDSVTALEACGSDNHAQSNRTTSSVPRFGLMKALNSQLLKPAKGDGNIKQCNYSPSTACHVHSYSLLVTTDGNNLRTLFLNLLSWLTYARAERIVVLMPPSTNSTLEKDLKYGQRILGWHSDYSHKVHLEVTDNLWTAKYMDAVKTDAVIWVNGDVPDSSNQRGLETGLELWKRHAHGVVAAKGWMLDLSAPNSRTPVGFNSTITLEPFCKDKIVHTMTEDKRQVQMIELHGLIVHRNHLCFLSHPILKQLHVATRQSTQDMRTAVSIWLTHLSRQGPHLYPLAVRSGDVPVKRRLLHGKFWDPPEIVSNLSTQHPVRLLLSSFFEHGRRLTQDRASELVTDILGFLGSVPPPTSSWCEGELCGLQQVPINFIPWMSGSDTCGNSPSKII